MNETERTETDRAGKSQQAAEPTAQTAAPQPTRKGERRKGKPPIGSVAQLIRTNYEIRTGVRKLQRADVRAILAAPRLEGAERTELLELARADITLQQTKQLFVLSIRTQAPKIANPLREFGRDVLGAHLLFQRSAIAGVLANPQSMPMESAVAALASADTKGLSAGGEKPRPKSQVERIRTNAIHCLLLLLRASQSVSLERLQRSMQKHLWAPKARRHRTDEEKLEVLLTSRDPAAAAVTFALLYDEAVLQGQRAEASARSEQRAQTRVQGLEQQIAELERRIRETEGRCVELSAELKEAKEAHAATDAQWRDNYETLKGRTLNRLIEESALLEAGLHALRRDPPKVRVMIDHADRAIEGLKREAEQIRRDTTV